MLLSRIIEQPYDIGESKIVASGTFKSERQAIMKSYLKNTKMLSPPLKLSFKTYTLFSTM